MKQIPAGPGQESVWDYPRPPRLEPTTRLVVVAFADIEVARFTRAVRMLETSRPASDYVAPEDVRRDLLQPATGSSFCERKDVARYWSVRVCSRVAERAAWSYSTPSAAYARLRDHVAFYADRVDACYVHGECVSPQPGGFYGGWVTRDLAGPCKGGPGTAGW